MEEIVVGCESGIAKRLTRLVKPSAKAKEITGDEDGTATKATRRPATRATRSEEDPESTGNSKRGHLGNDSNKELLLRVLVELKNLKDASVKQQELICDLQKETRETKEELKYVREQLEAVTLATTQSSPRASYAEVARTPPGSVPSNIRSLSSANTTDGTDILYCTVDTSRIDDPSAGVIRSMIETEIRAKLDQANWRCRAVTLDRKNSHRVRVACRNEEEHCLVKQVAEDKTPHGARVLRDELYPVKVDNVNRLAVLDDLGDIRAGAAAAFGQENDVQVAKVAWLSRRDANKAYGSMVVYMTKASEAKKILHEGFFYAGGESGYTAPFERRPRPEQCYNCQAIGHKAFQCSKPQVCGKCAKEGHHHSACNAIVPKCASCDGPHEAFSRNCRRLFPSRHD